MTIHQKQNLLFHAEARKAFQRGVNQVADLVKATLGPKGRTIVIERAVGYPLFTKDGATVARHIHLSDPFEDMGARLCVEVATNTNDTAGDGTTTATVLAQAMIQNGLCLIEAGVSSIQLKKGMDRAVEVITQEILRQSVSVDTPEQILNVAKIATNDPYIGELIGNAVNKVGRDGLITVRKSKEYRTSVESVEGVEFDRGYLSPYFITNEDRMSVELEDALVLVTDAVLANVDDILGVLNKAVRDQKSLLIVAEDVIGEALAALIVNKNAGKLNAVAVQAPAFGNNRQAILEDLAVITGATLVTKKAGYSTNQIKSSMLGRAEKVTVTRHKTNVVGGYGSPESILSRVSQIKAMLNQASTIREEEELKRRIARLSNGTAVIRLGADTETEMIELKDRVEDAIYATQAAVESGIVPGGGTVFISAAKVLDQVKAESDDQLAGIRLIQKALEEPLRRIAFNAGYNGDKIVETVKTLTDSMGYDATTGTFVNMFSAGIIDPAKVSLTALQNAASIASTLLTAEGMVQEPFSKHDALLHPELADLS